MSEKDNDKQPGDSVSEDAAQVAETPPEKAPAMEPPPTTASGSPLVAAAVAKPARSGSGFPAWLALILVLAVAAGSGWVVMQGLEREKALQQRIAGLEQLARGDKSDIVAVETRLQSSLQQANSELRQQLSAGSAAISSLERHLEQQQALIEGFSASDQDSWLRAEAQYLLRLANQRVLMARDPQSAIALLQSADNILRELGDPGLHEVRAAVAAEIAALRALPQIDVEGIYLRLSALVEQAGELKIFEAPERIAQAPVEEVENWQTRLRRGYEQALAKLSDFIVIRRRDVPMQALMDPQWEGLVRQNLRMLLEQAQVALLRGNQTLYRESLERARHWVAQFADTDEAAAQAMDSEIGALQQEVVAVELPDLARSVQALDTVIRQRPQPAGAE